jgi:carbonic anhydrase
MNSLDSILQRNKDFAAQQSAAGTVMPSLPRALPNVKAVIIGCADMRVNPADVFGSEQANRRFCIPQFGPVPKPI